MLKPASWFQPQGQIGLCMLPKIQWLGAPGFSAVSWMASGPCSAQLHWCEQQFCCQAVLVCRHPQTSHQPQWLPGGDLADLLTVNPLLISQQKIDSVVLSCRAKTQRQQDL